MAKILSDGRIQVEQGDTLGGIYGADWKKASGYTGDPTKLQIGTVLPAKVAPPPASGASATPASSGLALGDYISPEERQAQAVAEAALLGSGNTTKDANGNIILGSAPDEASTRTSVLARFQGQIDALEAAKAQARARLTAQYKTIGDARIAQVGAIQARRGLLGSDFGAEATGDTTKANADEVNAAIEESDMQYQQSIAALFGTIDQEATKAYADKKAAYSSTADNLVSYLNSKSTSKQNSVSKVVAQALSLGIDLTDPNASDVINKAVSDIGVSKESILSAYKDAAKVKAAADLKAKQENDKATMDLLKTQTDITKTKAETAKLYQDAASVGTVKSGNLKIATSDIAALQNYFNQNRGSDNYTNTGDYMKSLNDWQAGQGMANDFFKYYPPKLYLNPNDPTLPQYLKDALKAPDILSSLGVSSNPAQ